MDQHLHKLLDVTIIYPYGVPTFCGFLQGKCPRVIMQVEPHDVPQEVLLADEAERRAALGQWIKTLWLAKDKRISNSLATST